MADWLPEIRSGFDRTTIRTIWVAFALSLLLHTAVLWPWLPSRHFLSLEHPERGNASGPLTVQLTPRPSRASTPPPAPPPPSPPVQARPAPAKRAPPPKAAPRPRSTPPVVALNKPAPNVVAPQAAPPVIAPTPPPVEGDLSSYIEARRRARSEGTLAPPRNDAPVAPPEEDEDARFQRNIAANLGLSRTPTFGYDPEGGGGIFQIQRLGYDDAEFIFFGWNRVIRRNSRQRIEVQRGDASDIRIAVVRKMIAIIREKETGDFVWVSNRLGREITLSARPGDSTGLENFLMRDLFGVAGPQS